MRERRMKINDGTASNNKGVMIGSIIMIVGVLMIGVSLVVRHINQTNQQYDVKDDTTEEQFQSEITEDGVTYHYNYNSYNILLMGIDTSENRETAWGGQSDTMLLLSMDKKDNTLRIINIPRDTMAKVDVYDQDGNYQSTKILQITLQHAYGDGGVSSNVHAVKAVRRLFHQIPIDGYCSITMDGIAAINDSVGGVTITLEDEIPAFSDYQVGDEILLLGNDAQTYLRYRDTSRSGSSLERVARQNDYMQKLLAGMKKEIAGNSNYAVSLYDELGDEVVTNLSITQLTDLQNIIADDGYDGTIQTLAGEMVSTDLYDEYHVDEDALDQMILDVFYEAE